MISTTSTFTRLLENQAVHSSFFMYLKKIEGKFLLVCQENFMVMVMVMVRFSIGTRKC